MNKKVLGSRLLVWATVASIALLAGGCSGQRSAQPDVEVGTAEDWKAPHGSTDESAYSRLTQINTGNIDRLGLAWSLDLPDEVVLESTPLAVAGTLYFSGGYGEVYSVDGRTGRLLWKFDPQSWKRTERMHNRANRGISYEDGRIFTVETDGRVDALDAKTGRLLWSAESIPPGVVGISTGAPRTMNGKVIIGNGGGGAGLRGFVTAFAADTGKQLWRFYTVPGSPEQNQGDPPMEAAAKTWDGEYWKTGTGGTVWDGMTFDPETNRIYIGVGNAGPYDQDKRSPGHGDNLYTASIVALDADTGKYLWHYQQNPREGWDYKATPNMILATLNLDGQPKKVLMQAPTNGFFYVLDRDNGKLLNQPGKTTLITWARDIDMKTGRPIENPGIRLESGRTEMWPGILGGHNWQAMSYSPRTGLAYIPIQQMGTLFSRHPEDMTDDAMNNFGLAVRPLLKREGDGHGYLVAWDPVKQKEAWRVKHKFLWNGGTLATAGDVVFQGAADGQFSAFDTASGRQIWNFDAGLGIIAAPMSYGIGGKQYVSVLVGYGGVTAAVSTVLNVGWKYGAQTRRLLTFTLDGKGTLPKGAPRDMSLEVLDDPALVLSDADVAAGKALSQNCMGCHGVGFHGAGSPAPDLRESGIALRLDTFAQFLKEGRREKGMPRFSRLTDEQIRQLHSYLRARARQALNSRPPVRHVHVDNRGGQAVIAENVQTGGQ